MSLLKHRGYWRWSAGVQLTRLPAAMAPLAFTVLTTATTGSYRLGGVMMAVYVVAETAAAVPIGRLLDRFGPSRALPVLLLLVAAGFAALGTAASWGVPEFVLLTLVVLPGALAGGLSGGFRTLLAATVSDDILPRAVAVDAMILDGVLIAGPALVSALALAGPLVPPFAMAAVCVLAAILVPRRTMAPGRGEAGERPPVPLARCLPWLACQFTVGLLLSTIEVAPLPFVQRLGAPDATAPIVVAVLCGASIAGSSLYAWRGTTGEPRLFLGGFVAGGVLVAANLGWAGLLAGVTLVGVCTGPLVTVASVNLQRLLPERRRSEGFSLAFTVQATGFGLGSLGVGVLPLWLAPLFGTFSAATIVVMLGTRARRAIGTASVTS
ncbi:MFS transporter [Amycolatopsis sp. NPDC059021]|uniref:MFS transporter n=1 Tax=Amycolatopsis sp. NPDC059021 TaxID=3346704 RepID=UPI00366B7D9A